MYAEYAPETCDEPGHVIGCPGRAGGDHGLLGEAPCGFCNSTETLELHHPTEPDQSITICAGCGSDE